MVERSEVVHGYSVHGFFLHKCIDRDEQNMVDESVG